MRKKLDEKGRCCGRKPIPYKRDNQLFCDRCDASYDPKTSFQIANWKYKYCENCGDITESLGRKEGSVRDCLKCGGELS